MAFGMGNHVALISLLNCVLCICRIRGHVDCSLGGASCKSCMVAYPFCYWCDTISGGSCQTFVSDEISEAECPSHWSYKACLADESSEYETGKQGEDQMLKLILEEDQSKNADDLGHPNNIAPVSGEPSSKSGSMKELLRKLLLLKLLQKVRSTFEENRPGGMGSAETGYKPSPEASKSSKTYGLSEPGSLEYLEKVVNMLEIQKTKFTSSSELVSADRTVLPKGRENKSLSIEPTLPLKWTPDTQPMVVSTTESSYKSEELNLEYEDKKSRVDLRISITMPLTSGTATRAPVTLSLNESLPDTYKLLTRNYCELYDSKGACNMDNNCTWCNTVDSCIG